jgi:hypothetical protein
MQDMGGTHHTTRETPATAAACSRLYVQRQARSSHSSPLSPPSHTSGSVWTIWSMPWTRALVLASSPRVFCQKLSEALRTSVRCGVRSVRRTSDTAAAPVSDAARAAPSSPFAPVISTFMVGKRSKFGLVSLPSAPHARAAAAAAAAAQASRIRCSERRSPGSLHRVHLLYHHAVGSIMGELNCGLRVGSRREFVVRVRGRLVALIRQEIGSLLRPVPVGT